jgi:hypothetical protein
MQQTPDNKLITEHFLARAKQALEDSVSRRNCPGLDDWQWIRMGTGRVLQDERSGRGFLQD